MEEKKVKFEYKFGTMIEIPRAAVTAEEIAQHAEFFSFGTNDLTQMTYGYSRDDAERNFLVTYVGAGNFGAESVPDLGPQRRRQIDGMGHCRRSQEPPRS